MASSAEMVCPKCGGSMVGYERTGITVEQCRECRGIFLDLGELERLIDAEGGGWSGRIEPPANLVDHGHAQARSAHDGRTRAGHREKVLRDLFGE